jgi:hypothetical protein
MLLAALSAQRRHVMATIDGLSDAQLRTPLLPMSWPPIAAIHHLALDVERWWFSAIVADSSAAWAYFDANPGGAWSVPPGTDVVALYQTECDASDAVISAASLSATAKAWPESFGAPRSIGEIVLHVIGETATHAGQLDIAREMLDGRQYLVID